jgi:glycerophosphoryl diester phosphodiesterase
LTACSKLAEAFKLSEFVYAHRGLWTDGGLTENSLEALLASAEAGLGVEFDVRPAADGTPIVFHDPILNRMTNKTGSVADLTGAELIGTPLVGGGAIISLEGLLSAWPQTTPLLCELKVDGDTDAPLFASSVGAMLIDHTGPAAAMSFSPIAVSALPSDLMRGQLVLPSEMSGATNLTDIAAGPVDYFACHVSDAHHPSLQAVRQETPLVTWTVKDEDTCEALASITDSQIFEGFDPALAKRHILRT